MSLDAKCLICRNPDRRRLAELGWNGGMSADAIARVLEDRITSRAVLKHMKEHADGDPNMRRVDVEPERPLRDRVLDIQRMQVEEFERRIAMAKQRAEDMNSMREGLTDAEGKPFPRVDWSDFYDILDKDAQQAIATILKTQTLEDKREQKTNELRLGLFESMAKAGLAPKALVGETKALQSGEEIESD